jgi:transcriptional regulator with XRE-family HTH domain
MSSPGVEALARELSAAREKLGVSREQLAERAGLSSIDAIKAIEQMRVRRYQPATKRALERALGWEHGSFDDVLEHAAAPKLLPTGPLNGATEALDPMTASYAELGAHADWMSATSGDPEVGARWIAGVMRKRREVETSQSNQAGEHRRAM